MTDQTMKQMKLSKRKPTPELTIIQLAISVAVGGATDRLLPSHTPARSGHCFLRFYVNFRFL
jgi:hypothetical protein